MELVAPPLMTQLDFLVRIVAAGLLGGIIGYERQRVKKPAQLRDHVLVAMGACLFTIAGLAFAGGEASRVAANIVTGIGFLGGGAILREQGAVRGLTTAATWSVAAVGLAVGVGLYLLAAAVTLGIFGLLWFLRDVPQEGEE
jgi:putative Mg2+ transporter-C (MgtC) family protein